MEQAVLTMFSEGHFIYPKHPAFLENAPFNGTPVLFMSRVMIEAAVHYND
jgi:hypothetical protein